MSQVRQPRNNARREVEAMKWPEVLDDTEGELLREVERLRKKLNFWRSFGLYVITIILSFVVLVILEVI